jgi:hypothetical protein
MKPFKKEKEKNDKIFEDAADQLVILIEMISALPEKIKHPLLAQAELVHKSQVKAYKSMLSVIHEKMTDVRLHILAQEFDLEATKQEKSELEKKLNELDQG